jgi:CBS domain-containing protein
MAVLDPVAFLRATPPFDRLPEDAFDEAAKSLEIVFYPKGAHIVTHGVKPLEHLFVIRKGAVRLEREGATLQLLEEGEIFGFTSLITGRATLDVIVEDDLLAYRIPKQVFDRLQTNATFAGHFATSLGDRLRNALERREVATFQADLSMPLSQLVRPPQWIEASASVQDAARIMRDEGISSVLVRADPPGIVTDSDFRNKVLAAGLPASTPVVEIYSAPLRPLRDDTPIYAAWQYVLQHGGVRHLPVAKGDDIVGVVTTTDLLKQTAQGPVAVMKRVERLAGRDALPGYASKVAGMSSSLLAGGLDPFVIAGFVARLNDTLITRILRWAEKDMGAPPMPYAWIAFGSEGRMEQTILSDQDNALVYAEETPAAKEYFSKLAERAVGDLIQAGFPRCPGDCMATKWHGSLNWWRRQFREWIEEPKPQSLLQAAIFFDFRPVHGELALDPLDRELDRAGKTATFLSCLAKAALEFKPPAGLLLRLKGSSSKVDIKAHGVTPVVALARAYALEVGSKSHATLDRLQDAVRAGLMGQDEYATVAEAYRFVVQLRLREQIRMASQGKPLSNVVSFADLSSIERSRLREAFSAIDAWQQRAAYHFRIF